MSYQKTIPERGLEWIRPVVDWCEGATAGESRVFLFHTAVMTDVRRWLYAWWKQGGEKERWTTRLVGEDQLLVVRKFVKGDGQVVEKKGTGDRVLDFVHKRLIDVEGQDEAEEIVRRGLENKELKRGEVLRVLEEWERVSWKGEKV